MFKSMATYCKAYQSEGAGPLDIIYNVGSRNDKLSFVSIMIPAEYCKKLGIRQGDLVDLLYDDENGYCLLQRAENSVIGFKLGKWKSSTRFQIKFKYVQGTGLPVKQKLCIPAKNIKINQESIQFILPTNSKGSNHAH